MIHKLVGITNEVQKLANYRYLQRPIAAVVTEKLISEPPPELFITVPALHSLPSDQSAHYPDNIMQLAICSVCFVDVSIFLRCPRTNQIYSFEIIDSSKT